MSSKKKIWNNILKTLESNISKSEINTWFSKTECRKLDDNTAVIDVTLKGNATPLTGVTRMTCKLASGDLIDSDVSSNAITWTEAGEVTFDFSEHTFTTIPTGREQAMLVAYDPTHPDGQVVTHKDGVDNILIFVFVDSV